MGTKTTDSATLCPMEGLVYVSDDVPGITRRQSRGKFVYLDPDGKAINNPATIDRLNALAIPPAYTDVWICPDPQGHIQATARDARGRKQYRYHEQWKTTRDNNKYEQLQAFGLALARIRRRVERDMKSRLLTQEKTVAVVVRLLELTLIRVGNRQYAKTNKSYGLTTLRRRHTSVIGSQVRFQFRGKGGVQHDVKISDRRIATVIKRCMEIPGHELFQFKAADGTRCRIDSGCVNDYLKEAGGGDFTAKHYRTWAASVFTFNQLQRHASVDHDTGPRRRIVNDVIKAAAQLLGNTPTVCRECYIHPAVIEAYLEDRLPPKQAASTPRGLNADERRFFAFLQAIQADKATR
ncbi:DNA topoisomerase [Pollutimonas subterranea]|uniref:DNA topoisomerase n=1 Tax=Pollutimonas subterranea TaxID=2045210 RepID=A0A2N4U7U2_9BURK|nr:DNA topoisomerase IB [Pollutimonas subterranea]PLC51090.1 DNA topoisomerase [Pollutimonas subterranea]